MTIYPQQSDTRGLSICLLAGEASGDAQGALLARSLLAELARCGLKAELWGSAGHLMKSAGVHPVVRIEELSAMGFAEVLAVYPRLSAAAHRLQQELRLRRPDITILIDYPGLNMRLMEDAFHLGSCVVYHIPPKVWAHGVGRVARLRDSTYLVTCVLPFEEKLLRHAGVNAKFIGNPLNDQVVEFLHRASVAHKKSESHSASTEVVRLGMVPGSRTGEIERVFADMVRAFVRTHLEWGKPIKGVVPVAPTVSVERLESILNQTLSEESAANLRVDIELVYNRPLIEVLHGCRYAWVCSGTAAFETALLGIPHSVVYKMHWLSYSIAKRIVRLPFISLENLCAERELVPEFIQERVQPRTLSEHALEILKNPEREAKMRHELTELRELFPQHSAQRAAREIIDCFLSLPEKTEQRFHWKATRDLWAEEKEWGLNR